MLGLCGKKTPFSYHFFTFDVVGGKMTESWFVVNLRSNQKKEFIVEVINKACYCQEERSPKVNPTLTRLPSFADLQYLSLKRVIGW